MFGNDVVAYPKPEGLLRYLVRAVSHGDDLILDFFAGSGTTASGVWQQNVEDSYARRFVLVQLPEPLDVCDRAQMAAARLCERIGKPLNLTELTKEWLRRSGDRIKNEALLLAGDFGFRVFRLDTSNIRSWEPDRNALERTLLDSIDHIKSDRNEDDILYELLLKLGFDLCVPVEMRTIAGKLVRSIGAGTLIACLDEKIAGNDIESLAHGIAAWHAELAPAGDTTVVFRDSAFADDVAKTNCTAILEQHGLRNVRSL